MADGEKELQKDIMDMRMLESRLEGLIKQRDLFISKLGELHATIDSLDEIKGSGDVLFSLGGEAYAAGKITDKKNILVDIGAGVLLERSLGDSKETLGKRKDELEKAVNSIQNEIVNISSVMEQLNFKIQTLYQSAS